MDTIILSHHDVLRVIDSFGLDSFMDRLIADIEDAFRSYSMQNFRIPMRDGFSYSSPSPGLLEWMPLLSSEAHVLIKTVGYHPSNPNEFGLPTIISNFNLYDARTGHLIAILDGGLLTAMRTGATSAVATRYMASRDSRTVGIIGCGAQAVTQLHAMCRVLNIEEVLCFDIDESAGRDFADRAVASVSLQVASLQGVVAESDVLCIATSVEMGAGPVFSDQPVRSHLHINAVGSDFVGKTELPKSLLDRCFVSPDTLEQAKIEGECQQLAPEQIGPELFELVAAGEPSSRVTAGLSVFDSTGWALEDYVSTKLTLALAADLQLGTKLQLSGETEMPKSPYQGLSQGTPKTLVDRAG